MAIPSRPLSSSRSAFARLAAGAALLAGCAVACAPAMADDAAAAATNDSAAALSATAKTSQSADSAEYAKITAALSDLSGLRDDFLASDRPDWGPERWQAIADTFASLNAQMWKKDQATLAVCGREPLLRSGKIDARDAGAPSGECMEAAERLSSAYSMPWAVSVAAVEERACAKLPEDKADARVDCARGWILFMALSAHSSLDSQEPFWALLDAEARARWAQADALEAYYAPLSNRRVEELRKQARQMWFESSWLERQADANVREAIAVSRTMLP
jgi:hypothetical protein